MTAKTLEKDPLPYLIWDASEIIQHHAEYLREEDENLSEEQAFSQAAQDHDLFEHEWDYLLDSLNEKMKEINEDGYWRVEVENFGWRNLDGWQKLYTTNAKEFLQKILPDTDCTFHIFVVDDDETPGAKMLSIRNWHHDSPMGNERYYARSISAETFYGFEDSEDD